MEIVNGYVCKNCTDVENAKKFIDPARPKDGPNGENSPEKLAAERADQERGPAVSFAGVLAQIQQAQQPNGVENVRPTAYAPGASVSFKV